MAKAVQINPEILSWARETAGLSVDEAAAKLGLKTTPKATAAEKLLQVEGGIRPVSRGLLLNAVSTYRRPLITFYLPRPPTRGERGEDFRTITGAVSPHDNATLDALIRDVRARQQMLREVLADDETALELPFVGSYQISGGVKKIESSIRATLGITVEDQRRAKDASALFSTLRTAAERAGIYILLLGDLGSHHSDISEEVFRGFALADNCAPFVVINDNDAAAARSFTLIHELAHIWIGASGVSGQLRVKSENVVERFCNNIAGEFLLPTAAVDGQVDVAGADVAHALSITNDIARAWNVSQGVVTYRLLMSGQISDDVAAAMFRIFSDRWRNERQRTQQARELGELGPDYYVVRRSRLGAALLDVVRRALQADVLTHTKAAKILGVKATAVNKLLQERPRAA
jgi:Zn-dependent peptidase ImmA (M78 family)